MNYPARRTRKSISVFINWSYTRRSQQWAQEVAGLEQKLAQINVLKELMEEKSQTSAYAVKDLEQKLARTENSLKNLAWTALLAVLVIGFLAYWSRAQSSLTDLEAREQEHILRQAYSIRESSIEERIRIAQYYASMASTDTIRLRWEEYLHKLRSQEHPKHAFNNPLDATESVMVK